MALDDAVVVAVIGVVVIEGLWLAALTYLMWRRKGQKATPVSEPQTQT